MSKILELDLNLVLTHIASLDEGHLIHGHLLFVLEIDNIIS